jgi:hypothetical protein
MTKETPSIQLTKRFIEGLKNYNLTYDEIVNGNWKYCGGRSGRHLNYFKLSCKDEELPEQVNECVCGHKISENCYITNGEEILILGNCCIIKFIPKSSRTCEKCESPHKNRKVNQCNRCRSGVSCKIPSGFLAPIRISDELASFLDKEIGSEMSRCEIIRAINVYILTNKLEDNYHSRQINPDAKLAALLKLKNEDVLTYFNLQLFMKQHYKTTN